MAEGKKKENSKASERTFLGFDFQKAMTGNMKRRHLKTFKKKPGFEKEFGELLKKSILGG